MSKKDTPPEFLTYLNMYMSACSESRQNNVCSEKERYFIGMLAALKNVEHVYMDLITQCKFEEMPRYDEDDSYEFKPEMNAQRILNQLRNKKV